jgi:hypothetical protein
MLIQNGAHVARRHDAEGQEFCTKALQHNRRINDTNGLSPDSEQFFTFCGNPLVDPLR